MTYIDFEMLKRVRTTDGFDFPPIDVEESVGLAAELMRDATRRNAEAMAEPGSALSSVLVRNPSPRLRQRLAILNWLPQDPASDDMWYLDEPVELASGDNHLVADFVARGYAEDMNLLFAPDHGMFSGGGYKVAPGAGATPADLARYVRLLAERCYVARAVVAPRVPPTVLFWAVERAVNRANAARDRAGLVPLVAPARTTVGRWLGEFRARHASREGIGLRWRDFEGPRSKPSAADMEERGGASLPRASARREAELAAPARPASDAAASSCARAERAGFIVGQVLAAAHRDDR